MQRIACSLIGASLAVVCALVALLLSDALSPGRFPPMLGFWGACAAGVMLILGLVLLERGSRDLPVGRSPAAY
jgi:ABC-type cobalamin transport system permease subunit